MIKRDPKIMFAVFKKFLENPQVFSFKHGMYDNRQRIVNSYVPEELRGQYNINHIRWHVVVVLGEFVISRDVINAFSFVINIAPRYPRPDELRLEDPTDYLNWNGKKLYKRLQKKYP
jgi:hypothetical protein